MDQIIKSRAYLTFIRQQPCIICMKQPVDADHIRPVGTYSHKRNDLGTVPVCREHHSEKHQIGLTAMQDKYKVNFWEECVRLLGIYLTSWKSPIADLVNGKFEDDVWVNPVTGCHEWQRKKGPTDYPYFHVNGKFKKGSRVILERKLGREINPKMLACHTCDNRRCLNPDHLYEGSKKENAKDMVDRGRRYQPNNQGAAAYNAKLTDGMVMEARSRVLHGETIRALAKEIGIDDGVLGRAIKGHTWRHIAPESPLMIGAAKRASQCKNCRRTKVRFTKDRCHACYEYFRRNGTDRKVRSLGVT